MTTLKKNIGFFAVGHQAWIIPVSKNFYEPIFRAYNAGAVDKSDESEQGDCFTF
jgi:hypothetical protein